MWSLSIYDYEKSCVQPSCTKKVPILTFFQTHFYSHTARFATSQIKLTISNFILASRSIVQNWKIIHLKNKPLVSWFLNYNCKAPIMHGLYKSLAEFSLSGITSANFKTVLPLFVTRKPQIPDMECIKGLKEDLMVVMLYSDKMIWASITLFQLIRDYLVFETF